MHSLKSALTVETVSAGLLAAFVGFASSFPVVVKGLTAAGADPAQAASGLMAVAIAMGVGGIWFSLRTRMPVSIAWSTPGAALLAVTAAPDGGFAYAVGAFLIANVLIVLCGLWKPLGRLVAAIPGPLAAAMLAGILLNLCLAPVMAVAEIPLLALPVVLVWALLARFRRLLAVPGAVLVAAAGIVLTAQGPLVSSSALAPNPVLVMPEFSLAALIGIALPLFVVTMASQNIPGFAVLKGNGYQPEPGPLLRDTGLLSLLAAPFGGHGVNLAAITAAICAGPDAHPDPARRYGAAVVCGAAYVVMGLFAGVAAAFIAASPPILIEAVAGLALIGAFGASLMAAVQEPKDREAAIITFLVAGSGVSLGGIGGAFWGLIAGGLVYGLTRFRAA